LRITTSLVRKAARAIDADATLVAWVEGKVAASQGGPGRPAALSVRSTLMCLWLLNVSARNCHLINLPALVANLDPRVRRHLGIDYLDRAGARAMLHPLLDTGTDAGATAGIAIESQLHGGEEAFFVLDSTALGHDSVKAANPAASPGGHR